MFTSNGLICLSGVIMCRMRGFPMQNVSLPRLGPPRFITIGGAAKPSRCEERHQRRDRCVLDPGRPAQPCDQGPSLSHPGRTRPVPQVGWKYGGGALLARFAFAVMLASDLESPPPMGSGRRQIDHAGEFAGQPGPRIEMPIEALHRLVTQHLNLLDALQGEAP